MKGHMMSRREFAVALGSLLAAGAALAAEETTPAGAGNVDLAKQSADNQAPNHFPGNPAIAADNDLQRRPRMARR